MSLSFLSGFLLVAFVLASAAYVLKEIFGDRSHGAKGSRPDFSRLSKALSGRKAEPVNSQLVGLTAEVVSHSDQEARPMRVRVRTESWPARSDATAAAAYPVGATVKVVAVDGPVLVVAAENDSEDAGRIGQPEPVD